MVRGLARLYAPGPLHPRVCAQHGRDVMGWKSPVGVPTWIHHESMITTIQSAVFWPIRREFLNRKFQLLSLRVSVF